MRIFLRGRRGVEVTVSRFMVTFAIAGFALITAAGCGGGGAGDDNGSGAALGSGGAGDSAGAADGTGGSAAPIADTTGAARGTTDVGPPRLPVGDACQTANPGMVMPAGTVATAATSYPDEAGDKAIDGDPTTQWNAGDHTGWIQLTFPEPMMIAGIRITADASPTTNETYTLTDGTNPEPLAVATHAVGLKPGSILPDIAITPGTYSSITISVNGGESWVGVDEIALLTSNCP